MGEDGNSLCRVFVPRQQPAVDDKSAGATGDVDNGAVAGPQVIESPP